MPRPPHRSYMIIIYHIWNRGVNHSTIFRSDENYRYFLALYIQHIEPVAKTYAYCLLPNHFHFLVRTRTEEEPMRPSPSPSDWTRSLSPTFSRFLKPV